jgi:uncharacterized protein (DUF2147 family)
MSTQMKRIRLAFVILVGIALATAPVALAQDAPTPIGTWVTQKGGAHIQIKDCGGKLCGTIVWLKNPLDKNGKDSVDSKNPDPTLRTRKLLGLPMLNGFAHDSDDSNVWSGGEIYNPSNGKTYSCKLTVQTPSTLLVRGYVGLSIFGETQTWTRVN